MLGKGTFKTYPELARELGVSRVRVVQMLNLLKLDEKVLEIIYNFGEKLDSKIFGEKTLRPLIKLSPEKQRKIVESIFLK